MPQKHEFYMQRCLHLAKCSQGDVAPNPMVGAVLVCNDEIISEGRHRYFGGPHAEVEAIQGVDDETLQKCTLYVNLEPCAHHGKTPPCSNLIIQKKIPRVIIGSSDSFEKVNGKGIDLLRNAGIDVISGIIEEKCRWLNRSFFTFHEKKRPYFILKWAESLDGKMSGVSGERNLISGYASNLLVHQWRASEQAIMTGTNTIKADNPFLTVREVPGKNPLRIFMDKNISVGHNANVFNNDANTLVFNAIEDKITDNTERCKIEHWNSPFEEICKHLYNKNIQSVLVEGGAALLNSLIKHGLNDEIRIIKSKNKIIGNGLDAPEYSGNCYLTKETDEDLIYYFRT